MVQRAAIFLKQASEITQILASDPHAAEIAARFHLHFLCQNENEEALDQLHYDSVVKLYRAWPSVLTYNDNSDSNLSPERKIFIRAESEQKWIMNIDAWFLMPERYKKALEYLSPHVYFFDKTETVKEI